MTDLRLLQQIAGHAVDRASALVTARAVGVVTPKGDRDMVSELDVAVEEEVRNFLQRETPEVGFFGEEQGGHSLQSELTWSLDPVDGTANLVNGLPLCAISLGLFHGNKAVLGVIDLPFLKDRYQAAEGHGAYHNDERLHVRGTTALHDAIVAIGDYAVGEDSAARNQRRLRITQLLAERALRVRMFGSAAIDLVWVAAGKLDATITLSNHPWDMAAGVVIAREAGACVMDSDGRPHELASHTTVAAAPGLRDELLALLKASKDE
jgi:myo-inositol-1(or 4)-monophosphatase